MHLELSSCTFFYCDHTVMSWFCIVYEAVKQQVDDANQLKNYIAYIYSAI